MAFKYRTIAGELLNSIPDKNLTVGLVMGDSNAIGWNTLTTGVDLPFGGSNIPRGVVYKSWGDKASNEDLTDNGLSGAEGRNRILGSSALSPATQFHNLTPDLGSRNGATTGDYIGPEYTIGGTRIENLLGRHEGPDTSFFYGIVKHGISTAHWAGFTDDDFHNLTALHPGGGRVFALNVALTSGVEVAVELDTSPLDIASTGSLYIELDLGVWRRIAYTAFSTDTFTIASTDFATGASLEAAIGNRVIVGGSMFQNAVANVIEFKDYAAGLSPISLKTAFDAAYVIVTGTDTLGITGVEHAPWSIIANIRTFQNELGRRLGIPSPAMVVTMPIEDDISTYTFDLVRAIRGQMERAKTMLANVAFVETADLERQANGTHFSAQGQIELGTRMANARASLNAPVMELPA